MTRKSKSLVIPPKIKNLTNLRGDDLRRFALTGWRALGSPPTVKLVQFEQARSYRVHGWAWVDGPQAGTIVLMVPKGFHGELCEKRNGCWDLYELGQVYEHELGHQMGLEHVDMLPWSQLEPEWTSQLQIRRKAEHVPTRRCEIERELKRLTLELDLLDIDDAA